MTTGQLRANEADGRAGLRRLPRIAGGERNNVTALILLVLAACARPAPPNPPKVDPPLVVDAGSAREAQTDIDWIVDFSTLLAGAAPSVTFLSHATEDFVIVPQQIRVTVEGAELLPYPGPPIDPAGGAFVLRPSERVTAKYRVDGVFRLTHRHSARVSYQVDRSHLVGFEDRLPPGRIWPGRLVAEMVVEAAAH
ncbi:MAG: hypothetical protein HYV07_23555 [Deltaproteobacteria bacterium]|nr:hypothetical protein [Deltaproteobacteria bacterium]